MPIEKLRPSFTFTEDRLKELQAVVPEAFADGKINWDVLREALGEYLEDPAQEHFGLTWPGKREARRLASLLSKGTLVPQAGQGVNEDTTHNIFIEGENLEVLKILLKSYAGRIKLIYIDPPYNTGNDFVYSDDYSEPLNAYLLRTGQIDEQSKALTTNTRSSGRFHSNWLTMMLPRLLLARKFLRDDGVIFVSIDENELPHLKMVMDEVFGEENFISTLIWKKKYTGGQHASHFVDVHEYILVYSKNWDSVGDITIERPASQKEKFILEDEFFDTRGRYYIRPLKSNLEYRKTLIYPIQLPDGSEITTQWLVAPETFQVLKSEGRIEFKRKLDGTYQVYKKYYEMDGEGKIKIPTLLEDVAFNTDGKEDFKKLFDVKQSRDIIIQTIKPVKLLRLFIEATTSKDDIILDFFAGSCTTAQAVLELNRDDGMYRHFMLVQIPEVTNESEFTTLAELGKERIRRVIRKLQEEKTGQLPLPEGEQAAAPEDLGFRVFKLDRSHFVEWQSDVQDVSQLGLRFVQAESPLIESWEPQNLLTEILLLQGFPLDSQVILLDSIQSNQVQRVHSDACEHDLFVCLDAAIHPDTIPHLHLRDQDVFICLDAALTDQLKVQLADTCNLKVI